ncbi:MAG: hypothetical protein IPK16_08520 [Anaerolineales bacterium]|nr:hypothetical protein [Anaerolineales bacterium]
MAPFEAERLFETESARHDLFGHEPVDPLYADAPTSTFSLRAWFAAQFFGRQPDQRRELPEQRYTSGPLHHNGCQ